MLDKTDDIAVSAESWLVQFEAALVEGDEAALKGLFHAESYWRDVLALSWNLQTLNGADAILKELPALARRAAPKNFAIDPDRAAPRRVTRAGTIFDRGDLQIRDRRRTRPRHPPADPGCRGRQPAEGLDAAHDAGGIEGF